MAVSRRRTGGRVAKRVWGAALSVGARAFQRKRSSSAPTSGFKPIMSNQRDIVTTYKGRRPGRAGKRTAKWTKKVQKVIYNQVAPTNLVYTSSVVMGSATNQTAFYAFTLNGAESSSNFNNDLVRVYTNVLATTAIRDYTYLDFQSARILLRIANVSTTSATLNVYHIVCRRSIGKLDAAGNDISSPDLLFNRGLSDTEQVLALGRPNSTTVGVTPFMSPKFCQGYKIIRIQKVEISAGNFVEMSMVDSRHREIRNQDYLGMSAIKGLTRGFLIGIVGNPTAVPSVDATQLSVTCTKHWNYRIIENNANQSAVLA